MSGLLSGLVFGVVLWLLQTALLLGFSKQAFEEAPTPSAARW